MTGILLFVFFIQTQIPAISIGPDALVNLEGLPLLRTGTWLTGTDSHDVTGGNNDGFDAFYSYLYRDGDEYVLYEDQGPGCVYVIRTIGHKGNLRVYTDDSGKAVYTIPFPDLNKGKTSPFLSPLTAFEDESHGSSWCYVPIPYNNYCKLTVDEMDKPHFFNIFAHKYAKGTQVAAFDPNLRLDDAMKWWSDPAHPASLPSASQETPKTISIPAHKKETLLDLKGSGAITEFKIRFPKSSPIESAGNIHLRGYWDGEVFPQVYSPLSTFFALGCPRELDAIKHGDPKKLESKLYIGGVVQPQSLLVGQDNDGWLYCHFPMPFWKSAHLEVLNQSDEEIQIEYVLNVSEETYPKQSGYFHALWRQEAPLRPGEDFCVLDTFGHGHYVGCVITFSSVYGDSPYKQNDYIRGFLEGDARFYIDDNRTPHVASTGTEEYFNWGWYDLLRHDKVFQYPMHGYPVHVLDDQDHSVMYRFHFTDVVPYYRSFRFMLEHGPVGRWPGNYSATAFFYQKETSRLVLTDEIDIGDLTSEEAHGYLCEGTINTDFYLLPYEGGYQLALSDDSAEDREHTLKDFGRVWDKSCTFTAEIEANNNGVKLRRRSYCGFGSEGDLEENRTNPVLTAPQAVEVFIDGQKAGEWTIPSGHARRAWRDTDFEIPAEFTTGKTSISITLRAANNTLWDEYTYWIYTYRSEPTAQ